MTESGCARCRAGQLDRMKDQGRERQFAARPPSGTARCGENRRLVGWHRLDLILLEECPDELRRVDLEGREPGYRRDLLSEGAPRPGMTTAEDDVELHRNTSRTVVIPPDDLGGDAGVHR